MKDKDLQILIKAAHAGGKVLKRYFGQVLNVVEKSTVADFQTEADLESEKVILEILKAEYPSYNILSEEKGQTDKGSDYTLVLDPLDGTSNFILGIPNFSVSVALLYQNKPVAGVIHMPISEQTYFAKSGEGAFLDEKQIKVGGVVDPEKMIVAYACGYTTNHNYLSDVMSSLTKKDHKRLLISWSVANDLCLLASGKIESMILDGNEFHDYAAGKLIALEAGAKVIDFGGKKEVNYAGDKFIISNTNEINKYILDIIKPLQKTYLH